LMEAVPHGLDATEVGAMLAAAEGVQAVHDLHIWTLSSDQQALAAHIEIDHMGNWNRILPRLQQLLDEHYAITHTTLQPEDRQTVRDCDFDGECGLTL